jgi:hypothetical protein
VIFTLNLLLLYTSSQSTYGAIGRTQQWKHEWLRCCEMLPKRLESSKPVYIEQYLDMWFEELCQFERTTKELKGWGDIESVLYQLDNDPSDNKLSKNLEKIRSSQEVMQILRGIWEDEKLGLIRKLQQTADEHLRTAIVQKLPEPWQIEDLVDGETLARRSDLESQISHHAFICFRRLRDCPENQRNSWMSIFYKVEDARKLLGLEHLPHPNPKNDTWWTCAQVMMNESR